MRRKTYAKNGVTLVACLMQIANKVNDKYNLSRATSPPWRMNTCTTPALQYNLGSCGMANRDKRALAAVKNTSVQTLAEKTPYWATGDFHSNYDIERPVLLARQQWQHICSSSNRVFIRVFIGAFTRVCIRVISLNKSSWSPSPSPTDPLWSCGAASKNICPRKRRF